MVVRLSRRAGGQEWRDAMLEPRISLHSTCRASSKRTPHEKTVGGGRSGTDTRRQAELTYPEQKKAQAESHTTRLWGTPFTKKKNYAKRGKEIRRPEERGGKRSVSGREAPRLDGWWRSRWSRENAEPRREGWEGGGFEAGGGEGSQTRGAT